MWSNIYMMHHTWTATDTLSIFFLDAGLLRAGLSKA
jgi:hypothetical protein